MRRVSLLLAIVIVGTAACSRADTRAPGSTGSNTASAAQPPSSHDSGEPQEFPAFWSGFREALLTGDSSRVATMTQFPLEVRGDTDTDPRAQVTREHFDETVQKLLKQDSGVRPEGETFRQFLTREQSVGAGSVEPDGGAARVGDLVFERTAAGWRLVRVYLHDEV